MSEKKTPEKVQETPQTGSQYPLLIKHTHKGEDWEYAPDQMLYQTHVQDTCMGERCVLHKPSDHHMRDWPLHWRWIDPLGISLNEGFERICPHGIGHPDPDCSSIASVHGCDGCCAPPDADL